MSLEEWLKKNGISRPNFNSRDRSERKLIERAYARFLEDKAYTPKQEELLKKVTSEKSKQTSIFDFFEDEKTIAIDKIKIGTRIRSEYSSEKVEELAESISEIGLMNPIVITRDYMLVAGYHRILAFKKLGKTKIPYRVTTLTNPLKLQLQEIDENLVRGASSYLEECEQILRKKEIYEELYPEAKYAAHLKTYSRDSKGHLTNSDNLSPLVKKSFAEETSQKMNVSQRTIHRKVKIAQEMILDLRNAIRTTKLAKRGTDLLNLAKHPEEYQRKILKTILQMKEEDLKIEKLIDIEKQLKFYEVVEQNNKNNEIIEAQIRQLNSIKKYLRKFSKHSKIAKNYMRAFRDKNNGSLKGWYKDHYSRSDEFNAASIMMWDFFTEYYNENIGCWRCKALISSFKDFSPHHEPHEWENLWFAFLDNEQKIFPLHKECHESGYSKNWNNEEE